MRDNKSVNRSWLAFRFFNVDSFVYNSWCGNVYSVGPPTRLPQTLASKESQNTMSDAKVRIDLSQGIVEAEGSEAFVRAIYDDFKSQVPAAADPPPKSQTKRPAAVPATPAPAKKTRNSKAKRSTPTIVKDLDLHPAGKDSLRDFYGKYTAKSNFEKNLVFAYWLQEIAGVSGISEDHIFTCYRHIDGVKAPAALYQSLIDTSKRKGWLDTTDTDNISVPIPGVNHLEHDLAKADE